MKRILRILKTFVIALVLLLLAIFVALQFESVQTWLGKRAAAHLSKELDTEVSIERLGVNWNGDIFLEELYVADQKDDTLFYIKETLVNGFRFSREESSFSALKVELTEPTFFLQYDKGKSINNLQFVIDYFKPANPSESPLPTVNIAEAYIHKGKFVFDNYDYDAVQHAGMDYQHLAVSDLELNAEGLTIVGDSIYADLNLLTLREKSGFILEELSGATTVSGNAILLSQAKLVTQKSSVAGEIGLNYDEWKSFRDFNRKVRLDLSLTPTFLSSKDLSIFAPQLEGLDKEILLEGKITGRISNLKGKDLFIKIDENTFFKGNVSLAGLPVIEQTFITLDMEELQSNRLELSRIPIPPFTEAKTLNIPANVATLGQMKFSGQFTGFINDFVAYGTLRTAQGIIQSDISLAEVGNDYRYNGSLKTKGFNLGNFYGNPLLGKLTSSINLSGIGLSVEEINATAKGTIGALDYNGYQYNQLAIDGQIKDSYFKGNVKSRDPNMLLDFDGEIDFTGSEPHYDFISRVQNLDLVKLNFLPEEPYATFAGIFELNATGSNIENAQGTLVGREVSYCTMTQEYELDTVLIAANPTINGRAITVESSIADGSLEGQFNINDLSQSVMSVVDKVIPSYDYKGDQSSEPQSYTGKLIVKNFEPIQQIFYPDIYVAPNSRFILTANENTNNFRVSAISDSIFSVGLSLSNAVLDMTNEQDDVYLNLASDAFYPTSNYAFKDFGVDLRSENDTVYTSLVWENSDEGLDGDINGRFTIQSNKSFGFGFDASQISVNDSIWKIDPSAVLQIDSSEITVNNFEINRLEQFIKIDGNLSKDPSHNLNILMQDFDLRILNPYLEYYKVNVKGNVSGSANLSQVYSDPLLSADLNTTSFVLNDYLLGDISLESKWNSSKRQMELQGSLDGRKISYVSYKGTYTPGDEVSPVNINATVNQLDIDFINSFVPIGLSDLSGSFSGEVAVTGTARSPLLKGHLKMNEVSAKIDYLNTVYHCEDRIEIYDDMFAINYVDVYDQEGNISKLTATFLHESFAKWNFDVFLDTEENSVLALNTTRELNKLYYGKAYAQGYINISGYEDQLSFDITARSSPGTSIIMPLDNPEEVTFANFITFIGSEEDSTQTEDIDLKGIDLRMSMDITPDAEIQLIFDEAVGDIMKGRGTGHIDMSINSSDIFEMYGGVSILEGNYLFTLKNLINKEFEVAPGGTINWFGDPFAAILDIDAIYRLSAPLYDIMPEADETYRNRSAVNLIMSLSGNMLNPNIEFDVELPGADELVRTRVASLMSTELERNRQAFALLVLKKFLPPPDIVKEGNSGSALAENTSELLTSQINNWLSQISDDFDVGVHYLPGSNITNQELALALSTQLFDERLLISGNFGVANATANSDNSSNFIGDVRLEYQVFEDDRIRLVAYNEGDDYRLTQTGQQGYKQGVGVLYKKEFDQNPLILCDIANLFRKKEKRRSCRE